MKLALTTALILSAAAPAFASDQLARSLGLEAGVFTTSQLVQLKAAYDGADEGNGHFDTLVERFSSDAVSTSNGITEGQRQIAEQVGVNPADYTLAELVAIRNSYEDGEYTIPSTGDVVSTSNGISAGHAQLAAKLGVDAADYTVAELAALAGQIDPVDARF